MEVILTDLLLQSSSNKGGRQEAMFTPHTDNDDDRTNAVLTAICLLSETSTTMKICGKTHFPTHEEDMQLYFLQRYSMKRSLPRRTP